MSNLFGEQLQALRAHSLYRRLREIGSAQGANVDLVGKRLVNFSSNDYLGLANDPRLREAAITTMEKFGFGAGASRLISGTQSPHLRLENALAKWKETEAALCFSSGYDAALGTIPALLTKNDVVLLDKLCHASLIDGALSFFRPRRHPRWLAPPWLRLIFSIRPKEKNVVSFSGAISSRCAISFRGNLPIKKQATAPARSFPGLWVTKTPRWICRER